MNEQIHGGVVIVRGDVIEDHDIIGPTSFFPRRSGEWKWQPPPIPKWKRDFWRRHGFVESLVIHANGRSTPPWPKDNPMPEKYMRELMRPWGMSQSHWRKIRRERHGSSHNTERQEPADHG